jgi:type IV pilus assembly protein PilA
MTTTSDRSSMKRARLRANALGLTLVELMVVVTVIAILAMIAVVGFRKFIRSSHTTEATQMVGAIRTAQETYHSEVGQYANVSTNLEPASTYPRALPNSSMTAWGADCTVCNGNVNAWRQLPVHASGAMMFGYATIAGTQATAPTPPSFLASQASGVTFPAQTQLTGDWYVAEGLDDFDGDGKYCVVLGYSWSNLIYVERDGE